MKREYKIKAETWLAVAIICFVFVAETSTTTRLNFNPPTRVVLGISSYRWCNGSVSIVCSGRRTRMHDVTARGAMTRGV